MKEEITLRMKAAYCDRCSSVQTRGWIGSEGNVDFLFLLVFRVKVGIGCVHVLDNL